MKARQYLMCSLLLLMGALGMTSCVECHRSFVISDNKTVEKRMLSVFEQIDISGSPTVVYTQSDNFGVRVEGPENLVKKILTNVDDQTLYIRNKGKMGIVNFSLGNVADVIVYVSSPDLVGVRMSGSGDFISRHRVDTDMMNVVLRGSGDIEFEDIICDAFKMELVGSGDIRINQLEARTSLATLVGSGDVVVNQSNVIDTNLSLRGSGDISVNFEKGCQSAQCMLSGSGDIELKGELSHYDGQKKGSGDINVNDLTIRGN